MLRQPFFFDWLPGHPVFWCTPFSPATVWLTGRHATPLLWSWICIYTCQTANIFDCEENFDKKQKAAATLINSHKSRNNCSLKKRNSEHWHALKLLPQKMNFRTWVLIDSNNWLLIKNLAYKYCRKTMSS